VTDFDLGPMKNTHLHRCSHPSSLRHTRKYASAGSPTRRRGKKSLLIRRDATLRISGAPANGISQGSTCICLPARSRFGEGRGIFEQPAKDEFFSKVLDFKDENYSENAPTEKRSHNKMLYLSLD
jgi:hypothetical protein